MKRIQCACLDQTMRFEQKGEFESFKSGLDKKRIRYRIDEVSERADGSASVKLRRQYNSYDCGAYLD